MLWFVAFTTIFRQSSRSTRSHHFIETHPIRVSLFLSFSLLSNDWLHHWDGTQATVWYRCEKTTLLHSKSESVEHILPKVRRICREQSPLPPLIPAWFVFPRRLLMFVLAVCSDLVFDFPTWSPRIHGAKYTRCDHAVPHAFRNVLRWRPFRGRFYSIEKKFWRHQELAVPITPDASGGGGLCDDRKTEGGGWGVEV